MECLIQSWLKRFKASTLRHLNGNVSYNTLRFLTNSQLVRKINKSFFIRFFILGKTRTNYQLYRILNIDSTILPNHMIRNPLRGLMEQPWRPIIATNWLHRDIRLTERFQIDVTEKGRISPGTLTGLSWSVTVFCKPGAWYFTSTGRRPRPLNGVDRDHKRKRKGFRTKEEEREKMEKNEETR